MQKKENVLITGGAGFIGSNLAFKLKSLGYSVTIFDNFSKQVHGNYKKNPLFHKLTNNFRVIKGDVTRRSDVEMALESQEVIFHFAAETGTGQSMYEIYKYNKVNVMGTSILLDSLAKRSNGFKKIILASSRAIYGEGKYKCSTHGLIYQPVRRQEDLVNKQFELKCPHCLNNLSVLPTDEESTVEPLSVYGSTKFMQELLIKNTAASTGIPYTILRFQNVYGPGQSLSNPYTGILSIFSTRLKKDRDVYIFEDGNESRDFIYIDDVVKANICAMENSCADGMVFNVGSGHPTTVLEVAETLKKLYSSKSNILITGEFRKGDIRHNFADTTKIAKYLNFKSSYSFYDGIAEFTKWVNNQEQLNDNYENSLIELREKGLLK